MKISETPRPRSPSHTNMSGSCPPNQVFENLLGNCLTLVAGTWRNHLVVGVLINCHEPPVSVSAHIHHVTQVDKWSLIGAISVRRDTRWPVAARSTHPFAGGTSHTFHCPFVPHECLLLQRGTSSDRHWWDAKDSHEDVSQPFFFLVSELYGRLDPTWCRRMIFPSGSGWVLMYVPPREHKDFFTWYPDLPSRCKTETNACETLASCCTHSLYHPPILQSSVDQMESHFNVTKGQRHCGVDRIPQEEVSSIRTLPSNQLQSQLRHSCCSIGEVGHDHTRLPAFHIFKQLHLGRLVLKRLPGPPSQGSVARPPTDKTAKDTGASVENSSLMD